MNNGQPFTTGHWAIPNYAPYTLWQRIGAIIFCVAMILLGIAIIALIL